MRKGFRRVLLGEIATISSGGTPSRSNPEYWGGDIPWVKTAQIQNGTIHTFDVDEWITPSGLRESSAKKVPSGTILMAMYGLGKTRGQVGILAFDAAINQACASIQLAKSICRDYVFQGLLFSYDRIRLMSNTGGQDNLSAGLIKQIPVTLPTFSEQKAIASLLSTWDAAIEKTERLIAAKENALRFLVQRAIAKRCTIWNHLKVKDVFIEVSQKNIPDQELLSVTQDRGVIPRSMLEGRVMSPNGTVESYKLIERGDFAISLRSFQGGLEYSEYTGLISPAYTVLRPKIKIHNEFFKFFFKTLVFIEKYLAISVIGIRDGKQISIPDFMSCRIPVPPLDEQKHIAEKIRLYMQEQNQLKAILGKYKVQKRGLMQKLLTGEWRIRPEIVKKFEEAQDE